MIAKTSMSGNREGNLNITINRHVLFCYSKDQNSVPCLDQTAGLHIEI